VLVVEHDEEAILTADYVIDMGPAAGVHGGEIVAEGKPADIMANPNSITGQYLTGVARDRGARRAPADQQEEDAAVIGATGNNLKGVTGEIPVGTFTCITGVSGGGKSTFTIETLYKAAARRLNNASDAPARTSGSRGWRTSTRSSTSTSRRSAAPRARTRRPIPAPSARSATGSPSCRRARRAATAPAASASTSRAAAARPARATA
jgi:excinuclease UvrABC ATPase subunit